jgi:hypothetical protein
MNEILINVLFLLNRYVHVVATTLLVGGTLFYETVVPLAIADLKDEHQLAVFARARWVFKWIVIVCVIALLASGGISVWRNWPAYSGDEEALFQTLVLKAQAVKVEGLSPWQNPRTWVIGHAVLGLASLVLALMLVWGDRPPTKPVRWMQLNLMMLLLTIFLASATRNARLRVLETLGSTVNQPLPSPQHTSAD